MRNPHELNIRFYVASVTKLNDCLDVFLGYKPFKKIGEMEMDEVFIHSMSNVWDITTGF